MVIIGLVGKIGTGKTTVARIMKKLRARCIHLGEIGHQLLEKNKTIKKEIIKNFGRQILTSDRRIDPAKLAKIVSSRQENLRRFGRVIYPRMFREVKAQLEKLRLKTRRRVVVVEGDMLFESKISSLVDKIIMIISSRRSILARVARQGKFSREQVLRLLNYQGKLDRRKGVVNYIIKNTASLDYLQKSVEVLWPEIKK